MKENEQLACGTWLDGYQVQAQAPVSFIRGSRSRPVEGHIIAGSWSDPWWLYDPERGWAVARRWKNTAQRVMAGWDRETGAQWAEIAACNEVVVEPWEAEAAT